MDPSLIALEAGIMDFRGWREIKDFRRKIAGRDEVVDLYEEKSAASR